MTVRRVYNPQLLAEVARVCELAAGVQSNLNAVAQHFDASTSTAKKLLAASRKAGHHICAERRVRYPALRLECVCGWSCVLDAGIPALTNHTRLVHGRVPSPVERTPRRVAA